MGGSWSSGAPTADDSCESSGPSEQRHGGECTRRWGYNANGSRACCAVIMRTIAYRATGTGFDTFYDQVRRLWYRVLNRSSQRRLSWARFNDLLEQSPCPVLASRTLARWPLANSSELQEEPSAGESHARTCEAKAEWLRYSTIASYRLSFRLFSLLWNSTSSTKSTAKVRPATSHPEHQLASARQDKHGKNRP